MAIKKFCDLDLKEKNKILSNGRKLVNTDLSEGKIFTEWSTLLYENYIWFMLLTSLPFISDKTVFT